MAETVPPAEPPAAGPGVGAVRRLVQFCRERDVALAYAAILLAVAVALRLMPAQRADRLVMASSTNLVNLRQHPPFVLVVSAFVEPSWWQAWIVVPLVWAFGEVQRWLGRAALVFTVVLGHVGVTLFVATALTAGIVHGRISLSVATAADVGASYGLVTVLGLLSARIPRAAVGWYRGGLTLALTGALLWGRSFTGLGHLVGWLLGLGLALLVRRNAQVRPA